MKNIVLPNQLQKSSSSPTCQQQNSDKKKKEKNLLQIEKFKSSLSKIIFTDFFKSTLTKPSTNWIQNLPKAPIPSLFETLTKYLDTLKCILSYTQYKKLQETVSKFLESSKCKQLQKLLQNYALTKENWATELWLDDMYLCNQVPLPVNSNPAFLLPRQKFENLNQFLLFSVYLIEFAFNYHQKIQNEELNQEMVKQKPKKLKNLNLKLKNQVQTNQSAKNKSNLNNLDKVPLCMRTYQNIFTCYRRPGDEKDELIQNLDFKSNHIVVACKSQFFAISLNVFSQNNSNQQLISYLYESLFSIWSYCKNQTTTNLNKKVKFQPEVGLYTTEHRRTWWQINCNLRKKPINVQSLTCIEKCLFVLCLDDAQTFEQILSEEDQLAHLLHGSLTHSSNRWYDKFLNVIIGRNGVCGLLMEHSGSEGLTIIRFAEDFLNYWSKVNEEKNLKIEIEQLNDKFKVYSRRLIPSINGSTESDQLVQHGQVIHLQWLLDDFDKSKLEEADLHLKSLIDGVDLHVFHFFEFGYQWIKQHSISPDCFIQLALQITFYKMHGKLTSTYESGTLRRFRKGRVDNIRANTNEALLLARAICDELPNITQHQIVHFYKNAISKQNQIMRETINGYGIDNHLLGLREMSLRHQCLLTRSYSESSNDNNQHQSHSSSQVRRTDNLPEIFTDYAFKQFVNFQLSTSQVSSSFGIITGYGAVVRNGFGCCYNLLENQIIFMISSFLGGYNVKTNTYNNYNSNYDCSDEKLSRSEMFALVLKESLVQLRQLSLELIEISS